MKNLWAFFLSMQSVLIRRTIRTYQEDDPIRTHQYDDPYTSMRPYTSSRRSVHINRTIRTHLADDQCKTMSEQKHMKLFFAGVSFRRFQTKSREYIRAFTPSNQLFPCLLPSQSLSLLASPACLPLFLIFMCTP